MNVEEKIAQFNDSISWTPLVRDGHNYLAHELIVENEHKIFIRATRKHILVLSFFVGFSFFLLVVMSGLINLIAFAFFAYGCKRLHDAKKYNKAFDRLTGHYADSTINTTKMANKILLSDIKGLQIIDEKCYTENSRYVSYEINLVLSDGKRINVMDHSNKENILDNAEILSDFLNIPILNEY